MKRLYLIRATNRTTGEVCTRESVYTSRNYAVNGMRKDLRKKDGGDYHPLEWVVEVEVLDIDTQIEQAKYELNRVLAVVGMTPACAERDYANIARLAHRLEGLYAILADNERRGRR